MGREEVWKELTDLITEFRKRRETIPSEVMADLRAARTLINVFKADPNCVGSFPYIDVYLESVESYLILEAQKKFGAEFAEKWMTRLKDARKTMAETKSSKSPSRFVLGLPKGQQWVRVQITKETPEAEVKRLAEESGLRSKEQDDGYTLVFGESDKIRLFVKKAAEKLGGAKTQ